MSTYATKCRYCGTAIEQEKGGVCDSCYGGEGRESVHLLENEIEHLREALREMLEYTGGAI